MTQSAIDSWLERLGDRLNPILVKETRQALKSRQFLVTFGLLLLASLLISFAGVALAGPGLDYRWAGIPFFLAYFTVLSFAVFVVVPFGAYRSLGVEQEDRTFELLTISALQPRQVIAGKLLSAVIQMFIYYSAIAPYMAFTVLLKGIDVPSILMVLVFSLLASTGFSLIGLLLATLSVRRGWQVLFSVVFVTALFILTVLSVPVAAQILVYMGPTLREPGFWLTAVMFLVISGSYFLLVFELSVARLTFEADNRSSMVRVVLVIQFLVMLGACANAWIAAGYRDYRMLMAMCVPLCVHWAVVGSFLASEPGGLSARVARQVPRQWPWRTLAALFFPGPGTGLAFLLANLVCLVGMVGLGELTGDWLMPGATQLPTDGSGRWPAAFALTAASYVFLYCGLGALVVQTIRRWRRLPMLGGVAITWLLAALGNLVPTFFAMLLPEQEFRYYRIWKISDPVATLTQIWWNADFGASLVLIPCGMAALIFLLNLRLMSQAVVEIDTAGQSVVDADSTLTLEPARATNPA